jgi:hypothetical protein
MHRTYTNFFSVYLLIINASLSVFCKPYSGYYCVSGVRRQCPAGRFGSTSGLYKQTCTGICQQGYYCPAGSVNGYQIPCPQGTYGERPGLGHLNECTKCPNGATCDLGGNSIATREPRNR